MADKKAIYQITVEDKSCRLSEMKRHTLELALGFIMNPSADPQYIRAGEIILLHCWVDGDEEIKKDDKYLIPAAMQAFQLIEMKEAVLKKI